MAGVALCLALGISIGHHLDATPAWIAAAATLAGIAAVLPNRSPTPWLAATLVLTGWTLISIQRAELSPHDLRLTTPDSDQLATLVGTLTAPPELRVSDFSAKPNPRFLAVLQVHARQRPDGSRVPAHGRVAIHTPGPIPDFILAGRRFAVSGVLRPPPGPRAPGLFNYRAHLAHRGIHRELRAGSATDWEPLDPVTPEARPWPDRFQTWARRVLARGAPGEDDALRLLWAMTLGWKTALVDEVEEPFLRSGTMHVFAISGLHVALIANVLVQTLRLLLLPRFLAGLIALPAIWCYIAATGWQASAVRASIMASVVIASWMCLRPVNLLNSLALAAAIVLAFDPGQLFQAGFQLSFSVVGAIALLVPGLQDRISGWTEPDPFLPPDAIPAWRRTAARLGGRIACHAAVSAAAWIGSVPLTAWHFHLLTPSGLLANLLVVPMASCALASCLASLACGDLLPAVGECFNHGAWFWMSGMLWISRRCAEMPPGSWQLGHPPAAAVVLGFVLILALGTHPWRHPLWRPAFAITTPALTLAALLQWHTSHPDVRIGILSLRGGHSICLQDPTGTTIIDTGDAASAASTVHPYLWASGINRIQDLWLSHGDVRHVGGAMEIVRRYQPHTTHIGPLPFRSAPYRKLVRELEDLPTPTLRRLGRGDQSGNLEVLHPDPKDRFPLADDACLVLLHARDLHDVLVLGDLGRPGQDLLLQRHPDLRARIVITGTPVRGEPLTEALLASLAPQAVIVVDADFPATARASAACKARLRQQPVPVWFTSETGSLELRRSGNTWELRDATGQRLGQWTADTAARRTEETGTEPGEGSVPDETGVVPGDQVKDRHPHREPVGDLLQNHRSLAVGSVGVDLHAPVDRPRMHDQDVRLQAGHARPVQSELGAVLAHPGKHRLPLTLMLDAQQVHHVGVPQAVLDVPADPATHLLEHLGHQGRRSAERHLRPQLAQRPDVRTGHPAEQDVPHDRHLQPGHPPLALPDREHVQQRLGRMLVRPIPRIHHARLKKPRQIVRSPRRAVPQNDDVRVHRLQVARSVPQGFPLLQRGGVRTEIDDVRRQPLRRELETDPRPRRRLHKQVDHRLPPQRRHRLDRPRPHRLETPRRVQNRQEFLRRQRFNVQQMASRPAHGVSRYTRSSPPVSVQRTSTRCSGRVSSRRA